ncbi:MAG: alpha/beta hydrolase [Glaciihabitans sp.]|nr:alpha/beta hydrolase [Glaciihabitans sp.]
MSSLSAAVSKRPARAKGPWKLRTFRIASRAPEGATTYVILHGVGLTHRFYSGMAGLLALSGEVISFDLPGFGVSPKPGDNLNIEDYAATVADALDKLDVGPVVVIGHSMGAQIAIELARLYPAQVSHVVLVGPVVDPRGRTLRTQAALLARDAPLEPIHTQLRVVVDYAKCGVPWFLAASRVMRDYRTDLTVGLLTQPLTVIRGENDPIATESWGRWLSEQVQHGELVSIPGRRHNVPNADALATAAAIVESVERGH